MIEYNYWKNIFKAGLKKPRKEFIEVAIKSFVENGISGPHSAYGLVLVPILRYCESNKIPYILEANPEYGYYVRKQ